jgi:hypothetical protein
MSAHRLSIEVVDPIINNAKHATQELAGALENATCLFKVIEEQIFDRIVPHNADASQLHCALMIGIETLRQHTRVAYCIAEALERAA